MSELSAIEWTDHTFNPWWGCVKVSPGCKNCYADTLASRWGHDCWGTSRRRTFGDKHWNAPHKWKPGRVFCGSMCDVLEDAPGLAEQRERLWKLILDTPHLTWMLLTKRPERIRTIPTRTLRQVWMGVSIEDQEHANERIGRLVSHGEPAVRFISYEPALGPVSFRWAKWYGYYPEGWRERGETQNHLDGMRSIDWVICGGESGNGHRPFDLDWARGVRDECAEAGVPFFFKQVGGRTPKAGGKTLDGREWCEVPSA